VQRKDDIFEYRKWKGLPEKYKKPVVGFLKTQKVRADKNIVIPVKDASRKFNSYMREKGYVLSEKDKERFKEYFSKLKAKFRQKSYRTMMCERAISW